MNYLFVSIEMMVIQTNASFWDKMRPSSVLFVCQQLTMGGKLLHFGGSAEPTCNTPAQIIWDMLMYARLNVTTLDTSCVSAAQTKLFFAYIFFYCKHYSYYSL